MNAAIIHFFLYVGFPHITWSYECLSVSKSDHSKIYDYYWRDYFGIIPSDALPGGRDASGNPTYIGQVYIKEKELLPGTIYSGCGNIRVSAYDNELVSEKHVKILCVKNPYNYAWISTTPEEAVLLTKYHFVVGGTEVGQTLNIGRVNYENEIRLGKVFSYPLSNSGLWIPNNDKHETMFNTFELLVYLNLNQTSQLFTSDGTIFTKAVED